MFRFASTLYQARTKTNFCEVSSGFSERGIDSRQTASSEGSSLKYKHPEKRRDLLSPLNETLSVFSWGGVI